MSDAQAPRPTVTGLPLGVTVQTEGLDWCAAFTWARSTARIARKEWNGSGWVQMQVPDEHSKMSAPYLYASSGDGTYRVPWTPNQTDLFASDWRVV